MPLLTRLFIKTGLAYFAVAMLMGLALLAQPILGLPPVVGLFHPVYLHLLMVGWVLQLIIGVIYWMFPKQSKERPRGSDRLAWLVYVCLNAGLLLRIAGEPLTAARPDLGVGWTLAVSAMLQLVAGWAFIANTWGRVKER